MRINWGGGQKKIEGFINVDLCSEADVIHDLKDSLPIKDGSVEEIMAIHVIESFYKPDFLRIIKDWKRVLNGKMTIEFTDLDSTVNLYLSKNEDEYRMGKWGLYGNQDVPCDPIAYHHYVYTVEELRGILESEGFTKIEFTKENIQHEPKRDFRVICYVEK